MARYNVPVESPAAVAADTGFLWIRPTATAGFKLRRITVGIQVTGGATPTNMQCQLRVQRTTNAGTTPGGGIIPTLQDINTRAANSVASTTYATPPTVVAVDVIKIPFNSQAGADLPYEGDELYYAAIGTTDGFAFVNGGNALPANHKMVVTAVIEE
jgi:hypothetical protein